MPKIQNLTRNIFVALFAGALLGALAPQIGPWVSWLGLIFKLSLSMIVMPIIFTSITAGMGAIGDIRKLGRLGLSTMTYFIGTTFLAIILGLFLVYIFQPGVRQPEAQVQSALMQAAPNSQQEAPRYFTELLRQSSTTMPQELSLEYFENSLEKIAQEKGSIEEIRSAALKLAGALEFRERLAKDGQPSPVESISMGNFLHSQLSKALINPFEALADKQVLAVIIFTILLGGALGTMGAQGRVVFDFVAVLDVAISKIVGLIMRFAPFGVFGLCVDVVASTGFGIFRELGMYAFCVILGLLVHGFVVLPFLMVLTSRYSPTKFFAAVKPALAVAFATSSSSAALPVTIQCVEENLRINKQISRFVLPLGATINMNGTALYEAVAAVFVAQLYGVSLGFSSQIVIAITAALAAIGAAGIPAAGTVSMALVLSAVGLPLEGIGLLLAVDRPLDMFRTAVNVGGDAVGAVILSKWHNPLPPGRGQGEGGNYLNAK